MFSAGFGSPLTRGVKRLGALAFVVIIANPARMSLLTFLTEFCSHFSSSSFFNPDPRQSFLLKGFDKPSDVFETDLS